MNEREQRGLVIAATAKITQKGGVWLVPAQSGTGKRYTVSPDAQQPHCSCPDHETRGFECKHIYAVRFVIQRELFEDGSEIETRQIVLTETRQTYGQNWAAYNRAQMSEKETFQRLLVDLCKSIPESTETKMGRPRLSVRDGIFAAVFKVYSQLSSRRFTSDLCDAREKGYISRVPHFNSVLNVFDAEGTEELLTELVARSAAPLAALESSFAVDSSGISGCRFDRWVDHKWKHTATKSKRAWVKVHAMIGTKTNVVTAIRVTENDVADSPMLQPLMNETAKHFQITDLTADKAYLSDANLTAVDSIGGTALIPFKVNSVVGNHSTIWTAAYHYFHLHREEFLSRYHVRSNVESTFSMVKRKFGDSVKAKNDRTMRTETLAKFLAHNLCCLIHAIEELGIDPTFGCAAGGEVMDRIA